MGKFAETAGWIILQAFLMGVSSGSHYGRCTVGVHAVILQDTLQGLKTHSSACQIHHNGHQLWLGRKRQVWFIPLADERGVRK